MTEADYDPLALPVAYFEGLPTGVPNNLPSQPEPVEVPIACRGYVDIRFQKVPCPASAPTVEFGQCSSCRSREIIDSNCRGW